MASGNRRDITLGVNAEATGGEALQGLAGDLRGLGGAAAATTPDLDRMAVELGALSAETSKLRAAESAAKTEAAAARQELNTQVDALARLRVSTDAAGRSTAEHKAQEQALRQAVVEARIALRDKQAALTAASTAAKDAATAERALADQMQRSAAAAVASHSTVGKSVEQLQGQFRALQTIVAAALGGSVAGGVIKDLTATSEAAQSLEARLRIVTGGGEALRSTLQGVYDVANRSGVAVDEVGGLVVKLIAAGKELNLTNSQALGLAETLTQALRIGGASAQEAASSVQQFAQSIASGNLAGDELRSLLENSARLSKALADGLGVTVGQLKELGSTGALTSQQVIAALQGQSAALTAEFAQLPKTVSTAMAVLSNAWTQYIGNANQGSGATATAASAIEALARNLDTVASLLYSAGKAGAAFVAVKLGAAFLESAAAARTAATATAAATAATTAHTAATVANTTAQGANAAATAGSAAAAGRFAAILGTLKVGALALVLTNLREIGTAIGEGAARFVGYGKSIDALAEQTKREAEAARINATEHAAQAQRLQQAADAAAGLNVEAKKLVAEFDTTVKKSGDVTEAVGKLSKELRLTDVSGIQAAGAALDVLGQRGKLSGAQIKQALSDALRGDDLLKFETLARAAFDNSAQGARRLQTALDAIADEALRRAGTSVAELQTGFSQATTSAINDVDKLAETLLKLNAPAAEAGRAMTTALDQALATANTTRAVQALQDRVQQLGRDGLLTGDQLAAALLKTKQKLDELQPGVNSLAEAFRTLGLTSRDEAARTAASFKQAWDTIRNDGTVTIQEKIEAFGRYRDAAIAANGGVESAEVSLQRKMLETEASVKGLGDAFESAMGRAAKATRDATQAVTEQRNALAGSFSDSLDQYNRSVKAKTSSPTYDKDGFATDSQGNRITGSTQLQPPDDSGEWEFVPDQSVTSSAHGSYYVPKVGYWKRKDGGAGVGGPASASGSGLGTGSSTGPAIGAQRPTAAPASTSHTVTINLAGRSTTINTASASDATALTDILRDLEDTASRS